MPESLRLITSGRGPGQIRNPLELAPAANRGGLNGMDLAAMLLALYAQAAQASETYPDAPEVEALARQLWFLAQAAERAADA